AVAEGHINKWAIPQQIAVVTEIPKTSVGKLDKKRIRSELARWQTEGVAQQAVAEGHINKWAIPQQIAVVTEIPKTSVGKLDK
ncbi:hypothetical protein, partial [Acinetobacter baumannii]|uniref:hypothetical protein n=1 Tax=Acinetobacter baumannii TaxID=470 RepID=UPI001177CD52